MASSAFGPVAEAVFTVLMANAALIAALPGGIHGTIPQGATYPFLRMSFPTEDDLRGFGTGELPEIELLTHVYSQYGSRSEAQEGNRLTIAVLRDATLTITGYTQAGHVTWLESWIDEDEIAGVRVYDVVSRYTMWAEVV